MPDSNNFFRALGIDHRRRDQIRKFANDVGLSMSELSKYNESNLMPSGSLLEKICRRGNVTPGHLMLHIGNFDHRLKKALKQNADAVFELIQKDLKETRKSKFHLSAKLAYKTKYGRLYQGNCLDLTSTLKSDQFDLIFADPPFNLKKLYRSGISDSLRNNRYLEWTETWLDECVRLLAPGGSLFVWNLPKWNTHISSYLNERLTFRHWIAVDIKYSLPISGRLYPSHYSLLYYCKGDRPKTFHPDRLPMEVCPGCKADLKDYGGYKDKMNPLGINLTDIWFDIPPVRHAKYKRRQEANELSIRLMDRIIELSTDENDFIFDPFGGSGTTYVVSELKKRNWLGIELGPVDDIIKRLKTINEEREFLTKIRDGYNHLFSDKTLQVRRAKGLWTCESVRKKRAKARGTRIQRKLGTQSAADSRID